MLFNFRVPFLKMYIFEVVTFVYSPSSYSVKSFFSGIYKIHVFDDAFFLLTIRMPVVTKSQWGGLMRTRHKQNTCLHLQKTYGHQTRQGADLLGEVPPLKSHEPLIA